MALETVADLAVEQPEEGVIDIYALITARWVVQFSALLSIQRIEERVSEQFSEFSQSGTLILLRNTIHFLLVEEYPHLISHFYITLHLLLRGGVQQCKVEWIEEQAVQDELFHELKRLLGSVLSEEGRMHIGKQVVHSGVAGFQLIGEKGSNGLNFFMVLGVVYGERGISKQRLQNLIELNQQTAELLEDHFHQQLKRSISIHFLGKKLTLAALTDEKVHSFLCNCFSTVNGTLKGLSLWISVEIVSRDESSNTWHIDCVVVCQLIQETHKLFSSTEHSLICPACAFQEKRSFCFTVYARQKGCQLLLIGNGHLVLVGEVVESLQEGPEGFTF